MRAPAHVRRFRVADALWDGVRAVPAVWAQVWGALIFLIGVLLVRGHVPGGEASWILDATAALAALIAWTGANRVAIFGAQASRRGLGPAGLQFGAAERHVVAALLLNLLFLAMIGAVLALVGLALFGAAGLDVEAIRARDWTAVGAPWKLAVLGLIGAVLIAVPVLLIVRLALFSQATVGRGQPVSLNTLGIATGSFWRVLVLVVILLAPLFAGLAWGGGLATAALAALWLPFAAGALSSAYRRLEYWRADDTGGPGR